MTANIWAAKNPVMKSGQILSAGGVGGPKSRASRTDATLYPAVTYRSQESDTVYPPHISTPLETFSPSRILLGKPILSAIPLCYPYMLSPDTFHQTTIPISTIEPSIVGGYPLNIVPDIVQSS